jgi:hypothetical protein
VPEALSALPLVREGRHPTVKGALIKLNLFVYIIRMVKGVPFLDQIISMIVNEASPEQIILFGSYARGDNTEKSDIDLLIRKKNLQKGKGKSLAKHPQITPSNSVMVYCMEATDRT